MKLMELYVCYAKYYRTRERVTHFPLFQHVYNFHTSTTNPYSIRSSYPPLV